MKLIKAFIRHRKTEEVYNALKQAGHCCMTFVECEGTGQYSDHEKEHINEKYPFTYAYRGNYEVFKLRNDESGILAI